MARKFISGANLDVAGILLLMLFTIFGKTAFAQVPKNKVNPSHGSELDFLSVQYKVSFVYEAQLIASVKLNNYKRHDEPDLDVILPAGLA